MPVLTFITNLGMGGGDGAAPPVVAEVPADTALSAGSGGSRRPWQDEIVIPGVTHYVPKPDQPITPFKPKLEAIKQSLAQARRYKVEHKETARLQQQVATLTRSVNALEKRASNVVQAKDREKAIAATISKYRELQIKVGTLEKSISSLDVHIEAKKRRILVDDQEVLKLVMELL